MSTDNRINVIVAEGGETLPQKQQVQLEQVGGFDSGRCKVALEQKTKSKNGFVPGGLAEPWVGLESTGKQRRR